MQMLQDPWYNAAQQFGSGVGNYLQQATDRSIFRDNLSAAQNLMQSQGGNLSPTQALFGLLQASGGNPAFLQTVGDIFPTLLSEKRRPAGTPLNFFGGGSQRPPGAPGQTGQRLPDGNRANVPPSEGRQYRTTNGQPQDVSPYNAQMYQDTTGGISGPPTANVNVGTSENVNRDVQPPARYAGPEQQGSLSPDLYEFTPADQESLINEMVGNQWATPEQAMNYASKIAENVNNSNKIKQAKFEAERVIDKDQRDFLNERLTSKGIGKDPQTGEEKDPYLSTLAYQEWNRAATNPNLKSDTQRWNEVEKTLTRVRNAEDQLLRGSGSPYIWQDATKSMQGARRANEAYIKAMNAYNPKTDEYNIPYVDRAIALNNDQGWPEDISRALVVPPSQKAVNAIRSAPSMYKKEADIPRGWFANADPEALKGMDVNRINDPKQKDKIYDKIANDLFKNLGKNDSLVVARRMLFNNAGVNKNDFNEILDRMKGMGYQLSPFQEREAGILNQDVERNIAEILEGASLWEMIKPKGYLK